MCLQLCKLNNYLTTKLSPFGNSIISNIKMLSSEQNIYSKYHVRTLALAMLIPVNVETLVYVINTRLNFVDKMFLSI